MGLCIVAVGASAGGVETVSRLVGDLPEEFGAALLVTIHVPPTATSVLPRILSRAGPLPARHPADGEALVAGRIYVAPPDRHLVMEDGHVRLERSAAVHGLRPAIDPLFESVARVAGAGGIGLVLSGTLDDGSFGLRAIQDAGGIAIVQDPETAAYPEMPRNALRAVPDADVAAPIHLASRLLEHIAAVHRSRVATGPDTDPAEEGSPGHGNPGPVTLDRGDLGHASPAQGNPRAQGFPHTGSPVHEAADEAAVSGHPPPVEQGPPQDPQPGTPSGLTCPECQGALWEEDRHGLLRYRCRVGHAWGGTSLLRFGGARVEDSLWVALRTVEEKVALLRRLAAGARERGHATAAGRFDERAERLGGHCDALHDLIDGLEDVADVTLDDESPSTDATAMPR